MSKANKAGRGKKAKFQKTLGTRSGRFLISVRGLLLLYVLLSVLTILFSGFFFNQALEEGRTPSIWHGIVFFTVPAVLAVFLAVSLFSVVRDTVTRRVGSRFQLRLLAYFTVTVAMAAAPVTIITVHSAYRIVRFWRTVQADEALDYAQALAVEAYALRLERFEAAARGRNFTGLMARAWRADQAGQTLPEKEVSAALEGVSAVQDFLLTEANEEGEEGEAENKKRKKWKNIVFLGDPARFLEEPPSGQPGFQARDLSRDTDTVRYLLFPREGMARVLSFSLGDGFDRAIAAINDEQERFSLIQSLTDQVKPLLIYYYAVFFVPTLLLALIIAISFSRRVTSPLVELTEATRRVAAGDFSIHILPRRGDELGLLVASLNTMVRGLEQSRRELLRTEKITLWQTMAQQLAHEIKNPLTPIKLSAERVLRRWRREPERVGEILESSMLTIVQEVDGLAALLGDFKNLSRPVEPSRTRTRVREAAEEVSLTYRVTYPEVTIDLEYVDRAVEVKMDRRYLSQVLTNLVINGIDAMDGRGELEMRTDVVRKRDSPFCRLSLRDSGKGIDEEEGKRIFTPYFTTKQAGTGLGLPIVERIVQDHGGAIWFNSSPGLGTTFFVDLPLGTAE